MKEEELRGKAEGKAHVSATLTVVDTMLQDLSDLIGSTKSLQEKVVLLRTRHRELSFEQAVRVVAECDSLVQQRSLVTWTRRFTWAGWFLFSATVLLAIATFVLSAVTWGTGGCW